VPQGSRVTVTVSKGPKTSEVPVVTGDALADAEQLLKSAGFESTVVQQDVTDPSQDGLVLAQDPAGGPLEEGSTVTLFVGHLVTAPPVETVPTTTAASTTTAPATTTTAPASTTPAFQPPP
jgi:serine/threonine-protein kinase